jgi:hypothetical protein
MKRSIRNALAVGAIVAASSGATTLIAQASATPTYSSTVTTEYVYSPKCLHTHKDATRYYSYSSKAGRYIPLVRPSVTHSDSYRCHA